ncbi:hypothetical protein HY991_01320 [Candidatus Micrarchaeota archaeon]|nr:hypothetical protein [Candidatus Micrarchaeota archaeon]
MGDKPRVVELREKKKEEPQESPSAPVEEKLEETQAPEVPPPPQEKQEPPKKPKVLEEREVVDYSLLLPKGIHEEPDIVRKKREQASKDVLPLQRKEWTPKEIEDAKELAKKIHAEKEEKMNPLEKIGRRIKAFFKS